jgi:hypothetical protein
MARTRKFQPTPDALESRELLSASGFSSDPVTENIFQLSQAAEQLSLQLAPTYAYENGTFEYNLEPGLTQKRIGNILRLEGQLARAERHLERMGNPADPDFAYAVQNFRYYNGVVVYVAWQASQELKGHPSNPGGGLQHSGSCRM